MEQLGSHWTDFNEIWYLRIFRKSVEKIQVSLKPENTNIHLYHISLMFSYNKKCLDKSCRENQNTHFGSLFFFEKSYRLWENLEKKYSRAGQYTDDNIAHVQGSSNMTGTDLCLNKPQCAASVRPWETEATTSTLPPARVRTCSVLSGSC